jgi:heme-degrading monooxygenase HmoA
VVILEAAVLQVREGAEAGFEEAMVKAAPAIAGSPGYIGHELQRCVETKGRYLLLVRWETVEAHTVGFRQSSAFVEWRTLIGPFFEAPPMVEHYEGALMWPRS